MKKRKVRANASKGAVVSLTVPIEHIKAWWSDLPGDAREQILTALVGRIWKGGRRGA